MTVAYCLKCKKKRKVLNEVHEIIKGRSVIKGDCSVCGTRVTKLMGMATMAKPIPNKEVVKEPTMRKKTKPIPKIKVAMPDYAGRQAQALAKITVGGGVNARTIPKDSEVLILEWGEGDSATVEYPKDSVILWGKPGLLVRKEWLLVW